MDSILSVIVPEAMIKSIESMSKNKNCSSNTVIKLAIAKFLFDQTLSTPEVCKDQKEQKQILTQSQDLSEEIPLDRIVAAQYTLDDGRVINVIRQSKMR